MCAPQSIARSQPSTTHNGSSYQTFTMGGKAITCDNNGNMTVDEVGNVYWIGGCVSYTRDSGTATGVGILTPQLGVSYNYSLWAGNVGFGW